MASFVPDRLIRTSRAQQLQFNIYFTVTSTFMFFFAGILSVMDHSVDSTSIKSRRGKPPWHPFRKHCCFNRAGKTTTNVKQELI